MAWVAYISESSSKVVNLKTWAYWQQGFKYSWNVRKLYFRSLLTDFKNQQISHSIINMDWMKNCSNGCCGIVKIVSKLRTFHSNPRIYIFNEKTGFHGRIRISEKFQFPEKWLMDCFGYPIVCRTVSFTKNVVQSRFLGL